MSKEKDIADIVKELDSLTIDDTRHILKYIKTAKERNAVNQQQTEPPAAEYLDSEGAVLHEGDKVVLLTPGVDNHKYKEGRVHKLPKVKGKWIHLIPKRFFSRKHPLSIRKHSTNVRKIQH